MDYIKIGATTRAGVTNFRRLACTSW